MRIMKRNSPTQTNTPLPTLCFHGAAGEVTGSCHEVTAPTARFLLDCGLHQGGHEADKRNRQFDFRPRDIDFVLLSHAHLDHSGLIPKLVAGGFKGPIYATAPTCDLVGVLLKDSAHLQEKDAERESRGRKRAVQPLYTVKEAEQSLKSFKVCHYGKAFSPAPGIECIYRDAGHILGSSSIEVRMTHPELGRHVLVYSGDLGQPGHPLMRDPQPVPQADTLLLESTYGNRLHKNPAQTQDELAYAITDTIKSHGGNVVIPAFAVGRTQDILVFIAKLARAGRVPPLTLYVDSPMAETATRMVMAYPEFQDEDAAALRDLVAGKVRGVKVHLVNDVEESRRINQVRQGAVIISASGMCEGGRIRHHLSWNLPHRESAIVFAGFQAEGTLGRRLVDGAKAVTLFGESVPVRARIFTIGGLSAHADQAGLLQWLSGFHQAPASIQIVHGEPLSAMGLRDEIRLKLDWASDVATLGKTIELPWKKG